MEIDTNNTDPYEIHRSNTSTIINPPPSDDNDPFYKSIIDAFRRKRGVIIIAALILVVSVSFFCTFWILLRPHKSQFSLVLSASYSNPTVENCFNYTLNEPLKIIIANPNDADLVIGSLNVSVFYHDTTKVWATVVNGPIHVGSMKVKMMFEREERAHNKMDDHNVTSWEQVGGVLDPIKNTHFGRGDFIAKISVIRAKFKKLGGLFIWRMHWDVRCNILDVTVSDPDGHNKWDSTGLGFCQDE
ncbi:uncharacterized protein LOC110269576 [Arachis ipaensis]|uniref:uncharacterized protein LOC110269576 n=1 Tax=Arachis ipaensis TaxID=130454 RepID=UPI000A2B4D99|nr:uncharacterized protein LOC110269576 [Arachis ipaensis]XP_025641073.1 uncharacterized protein LOC112735789 [Arachis hypogaea]QHN99957.1 uncharacterized protein DS421_13g402350 [Arachis hypogaea]